MVICLEQGADLHTAQLMPLPLTVSCFSKIQIGFTFLVPAHVGSPGHRAVKRYVCVLWVWQLGVGRRRRRCGLTTSLIDSRHCRSLHRSTDCQQLDRSPDCMRLTVIVETQAPTGHLSVS